MKAFNCVISCLLFCLFFFACTSQNASTNATAKVGVIAPDFTLKDIAGNTIELSSYKDKVVLLEFWAPWCPPCKASIPELIRIQEKYNIRGFTVIGISIDNTQNLVAQLSEFAQENHINYPILMGNEDIARRYHIRSIPASFLIDKKGRIANEFIGYTDDLNNRISEQIEKII